MRPPLRAAAVLAVALTTTLVTTLLTGCGSGDDWSGEHPAPSALGTLGPGFTDPSAPPTPEATVTPRPGSWDGVHPSKNYRVVLLTEGDDKPTKALVKAVKDWAGAEDADLRTVVPDSPSDLIPAITRAMDMKPDLIVGAGNALIDPLMTVTPNHLAQHFLVIGAELPEPTHNVTAVNWTGASFRGEGLDTSSRYDEGSFTPERCAAAIRAGVAAVLTDVTGIVISLDAMA
ncbi:hypothetical protein ACIQNU_20820 [Streptomyces sp. NPDC091292]|uniref:hypothetical protein n=1 Tax=Streptomyces sp. NPDC091292 TaxID=3365991 RepID=UPI0037FCA3F2